MKFKIRKNKIPFVQRFKQASVGGKFLLIFTFFFKFFGLLFLHVLFQPNKERKIAYRHEGNEYIGYYEDNGEIVFVQQLKNFKH